MEATRGGMEDAFRMSRETDADEGGEEVSELGIGTGSTEGGMSDVQSNVSSLARVSIPSILGMVPYTSGSRWGR